MEARTYVLRRSSKADVAREDTFVEMIVALDWDKGEPLVVAEVEPKALQLAVVGNNIVVEDKW